jgi:WD40 repeat protein
MAVLVPVAAARADEPKPEKPVLTLPGRVVVKTDGKEVGELLGPTIALAYSPGGNSLVSVASVPAHMGTLAKQPHAPTTTDQLPSASSAVKLWDARTGKELRAELHGFDIGAPVFSPDGKRLAFATWPGAEVGRPPPPDSVIKVWEGASGKELLSLKWPKQRVESLAISPDGKRLAAGGGTGVKTGVKVWDAETGKELYTFGGLSGEAFCLGFSPDGQRLAAGTRNFADQEKARGIRGEVRFWDLTTGKPAATWKPHGQYVKTLAYSPDGKRLALGLNHPAPVKVCDAETGREVLSLPEQGKEPLAQAQALAFSPDGTRLAAIVSEEKTAVKVWDAATGKLLMTLPLADARCITFAPDGSRLAVGGPSGVTVWQVGQ